MRFAPTICAAAAALAAGACAAADVTVYGIVDTYVAVYNNGDKTSVFEGSGGKAGSRYGFKGSEDLGGGTSVFFQLENGILSDTGTTTGGTATNWAFQRLAVLGVKNEQYGTLSAGRQYSLNFTQIAQFDPFGVTLGSVIGNYMAPVSFAYKPGIAGMLGADNFIRRDNSVQYSTPSLNGLTLTVQASFGEQKAGDDHQSSTLGNSYAVQGVYRNGPFAAGLTVSMQNMDDLYEQYSKRTNNVTANAGASYDFGVTKLYANVIYKHGDGNRTFKNADTPYNPNLYIYALQSKTPLWGGSMNFGAAYLKNDSASESDSWNVQARYDYPLSRRTTLYCGAGYLNNEERVRYDIGPGGGGSASPATNAGGDNVWMGYVGLNVTF
ncbi:MAG: porin [Duodenibacillus sp.]|nr:porin [Duodenibacillus sp.]